jgi:hypothetical protein
MPHTSFGLATRAGGDDMLLSELERRALAHASRDTDYRVEIFGPRLDDPARDRP